MTKFELGEKVMVEAKVVMIKRGYDIDGKVVTTYTLDIPKAGKTEYSESEIIRRPDE